MVYYETREHSTCGKTLYWIGTTKKAKTDKLDKRGHQHMHHTLAFSTSCKTASNLGVGRDIIVSLIATFLNKVRKEAIGKITLLLPVITWLINLVNRFAGRK